MSVHIAARSGDIAETVLLPGDPLRAQWIANTFLQDVACYSTVRNMLGFTGTSPGGDKVSVQGAGMGMPSLSIYVHELINDYGVKRVIRVGSCGALQKHIGLRDVVMAVGACSDSALNKRRFKGMDFAPVADWQLLHQAYEAATRLNIPVRCGNIFATDRFYDEVNPDDWQLFADFGVLAVEMETAELYTVAAKKKVPALTILQVSDNLVTKEHLSAEERERSFSDMVRIALEL